MKQILGTMTFGDQVDQDTAQEMLAQFTGSGNYEIDTAHIYCDGRTEEMLGRLLPPAARDKLYIASKVNPWNDDGLKPASVKKQMTEILQRLSTDRVDLLYLHYASWQVAEVAETCRRNGWMEPTVYQGMYNALTRDVERELFPCLRNYDIRFNAYNPLAGGMLTGKHLSMDDIPDSGRFNVERGYLDRYWKQDYFDVLQDLQTVCQELNLKPVEVALSWLVNHSLLDHELGDGIILGASKVEHLAQNMAACKHAPLDQAILEILDRGWEIIKPNCFKYFRP
jgi:aflatoxin B1 aldehyde reductase